MNKCIVRLETEFGRQPVDPTTIESCHPPAMQLGSWYSVLARQAVVTLMKRGRIREAAPGRLAALEVHSSVRCVQCNSS